MIVSELFRSLQGEGKNQGRPCTFIRLVGCNLRCAWCDTSYAYEGGVEMSVAEVLDHVWLQNGKYISITGGEPLLWADEVFELLKRFAVHDYQVEIETNG
ncbi:MAG: 7-carboxy-7-deazaguanine synthase QueE, partial [Methanomicrobiales archaeon]|nr:7-carboxy-7-deazaguanine synthase QueE [Methanomicrobiales archaeon]